MSTVFWKDDPKDTLGCRIIEFNSYERAEKFAYRATKKYKTVAVIYNGISQEPVDKYSFDHETGYVMHHTCDPCF